MVTTRIDFCSTFTGSPAKQVFLRLLVNETEKITSACRNLLRVQFLKTPEKSNSNSSAPPQLDFEASVDRFCTGSIWSEEYPAVPKEATLTVSVPDGGHIGLDFIWPCPATPYGAGLRVTTTVHVSKEHGIRFRRCETRLWFQYICNEGNWESRDGFGQLPDEFSLDEWIDQGRYDFLGDALGNPLFGPVEGSRQARLFEMWPLDASQVRYVVSFADDTRVDDKRVANLRSLCRLVVTIGPPPFAPHFWRLPINQASLPIPFEMRREQIWYRGLFQVCASQSASSEEDDGHWHVALRWRACAEHQLEHTGYSLTPSLLWRALVETPYLASIQTQRSGWPVSAMPGSFSEWDGIEGSWWLRYEVAASPAHVRPEFVSTQLVSVVGPPLPKEYGQVCQVAFPNFLNHDGRTLRRSLTTRFFDIAPLTPLIRLAGEYVASSNKANTHALFQFDAVDVTPGRRPESIIPLSEMREITKRPNGGDLDLLFAPCDPKSENGFQTNTPIPDEEGDYEVLCVDLASTHAKHGQRITRVTITGLRLVPSPKVGSGVAVFAIEYREPDEDWQRLGEPIRVPLPCGSEAAKSRQWHRYGPITARQWRIVLCLGADDFQGCKVALQCFEMECAPILFRLGALDLAFGGEEATGAMHKMEAQRADGPRVIVRRAGPHHSGQAPFILIDCRLFLRALYAGPGGQDPEVGYETLARIGRRPPPLVIPLGDPMAIQGPLDLEIQEYAGVDSSRSLKFLLHKARAGEGEYQTSSARQDSGFDVVVLDPAPFNVVRVRAQLGIPLGDVLGTYTVSLDVGNQWDLVNTDPNVTLLLPPQTIGEEMIKGNGSFAPQQGQLFDFRLSPPARVVLQRSELKGRARMIAPWDLRRLLGLGASEISGAAVTSLELELLYGLTARIADPTLRLAEIEAVIGRLPLESDVFELYQLSATRSTRISSAVRTSIQESDAFRTALTRCASQYAKNYVDWLNVLLRRFAVWQAHHRIADRSPVQITQAVTHHFRDSRSHANPIDPTNADGRSPLKGGVDWGFESQNIYQEVLAQPTSISSRVSDLSLTALGATGSQEAAFAQGKSIISSVTRQGRTQTVTIIRKGRISMLWNTARHVLVYERTVKRANRYKDEQPDFFEGLAAMRKVREYVEITQQRRSYPDLAGEPRTAGPFKANSFERLQIDVRSEWGHDVEGGWVMPLYGYVPAGQEPFYPKPDVRALLAPGINSAPPVACRVQNPEVLQFYTSTRAQDNDQTDLWPAVAGIDFPIAAEPVPPPLATHSPADPDAPLPDPLAVEPGLEGFTLLLEPSEQTVDLVAGRQDKPLKAIIHNLCIARSQPAPIASDSVYQKGGKAFQDADAVLRDQFAQLQQALAPRLLTAAAEVRARATRLVQQVDQTLRQAQQQLKEVQEAVEKVPSVVSNWVTEQTNLLNAWKVSAQKKLNDAITNIQREVSAVKSGAEATARRFIHDELEHLRQSLNAVAFWPEQLQQQLANARTQAKNAIQAITDQALGRVRQTIDRVQILIHTDVNAARSRVLADLEAARQQADQQTLSLERQVYGLLRRYVGDVADNMKEQEKTIHGLIDHNLTTPLRAHFDQWHQQVAIANDWVSKLDKLRLVVKMKFTDIADNAIRAIDAALVSSPVEKPGTSPVVLAVASAVKDARAELQQLQDEGKRYASELCKRIGDAVAFNKAIGDLQGWGKKVLEGTSTTLVKAVKKLSDDPRMKSVVRDVDKSFKTLHGQLDKYQKTLANFQQALQGSDLAAIKEKAKAVRDDVDAVLAKWQPCADLVHEAMRLDFKNKSLPQKADTVLRLVRAFGQAPITEALDFTRRKLGYYFFNPDSPASVLTTPAAALFNRLGNHVLNPLGTRLPFKELAERLVPVDLQNLRLGDLLPDFGGLKLDNLFPGLNVPYGDGHWDWVQVKHGIDKEHLTAWAQVDINTDLAGSPHLFDAGPISIVLQKPHFQAHCRIETDAAGHVTRQVEARLSADWQVRISSAVMLTFRKASLIYDNGGHLRFDIQPGNIRLAPALDFLADLLNKVMPGDSPFKLVTKPEGVAVQLDLALPDLTGGVFSLTNLALHGAFELLVAPRFQLGASLWLAKPDRPFNLSVLCLGGGGWFGLEVTYAPPRQLNTHLSIGISAGATLALNFGVASGSVFILFRLGVEFYAGTDSDASKGTEVRIGLLIAGELRILGVVSVSLTISFDVEYRAATGSIIGRGWLRVSIKICWCITISVSTSVTINFKKGNGGQPTALPWYKRLNDTQLAMAGDPAALLCDDMPIDEIKALNWYFETLALAPEPCTIG